LPSKANRIGSRKPANAPAHLRPITIEISTTWSPEQALAVYELLDACERKSGIAIITDCKTCSCSNCNLPGIGDGDASVTPNQPRAFLTVARRRPSTTARDGSPTTNPCIQSRRPSRRLDQRSLSTPRTVAVQHARRAPPQAARSVLDGPSTAASSSLKDAEYKDTAPFMRVSSPPLTLGGSQSPSRERTPGTNAAEPCATKYPHAGVKQWSGKHSFGELKRITELASVYRQQLVAAVTPLVRELTRAVREA
jgi:hypothetical protein